MVFFNIKKFVSDNAKNGKLPYVALKKLELFKNRVQLEGDSFVISCSDNPSEQELRVIKQLVYFFKGDLYFHNTTESVEEIIRDYKRKEKEETLRTVEFIKDLNSI